jgi:hypothetical protein
MNRKPPPGYDARGLTPDAARMGEAHHVRRDPDTAEISWPPSRMAAVLRELKLIDEKDPDT